MKNLKEVKINELIYPNIGRGTFEDQEVRAKGALPGRTYGMKLKKKKSGFVEGKIVETLSLSPREDQVGCGNYDCGGCSFQSFTYEDEKEMKLHGLTNLAEDKDLDLSFNWHDNPRPKYYRNKMEYTFGDQEKGGLLYLGLHRKNRFYEIVETPSCNICHPDFEKIRKAVQDYFREIGQAQYVRSQHQGFLRHLVVRYALTTGQILINLVTSSQDDLDKGGFVDLILGLDLKGQVMGILHTINDTRGDTVQADDLRLIYGQDHIHERVLGLDFKVSAFSFFQPNVYGIERLYTRALEITKSLKPSVVFDLYSGTGTISQVLAQEARKVIGVEIVEEAVEAAKVNADLNGIDNVEFRAADVLEEIDKLTDSVDLIVLDPPRSGIVPKALEKILNHGPKNFIYISCNPRSMMEDLKVFFDRGYRLVGDVEVYDQFTRTYHLESLVHLTKR